MSHLFLKIFSPFILGSSSTAHSLSGECQSTGGVLPPQSFRGSGDNAYTIGFAPVPVFNNLQGYPNFWKDSGYGTNRPKSRNSMQTFSTGTLPCYFPQQHREASVRGTEIQNQSPHFVTVSTALEVATIF